MPDKKDKVDAVLAKTLVIEVSGQTRNNPFKRRLGFSFIVIIWAFYYF